MSLGLLEVFLILPKDYFLIGGIVPGAGSKSTKSESTHCAHHQSSFIQLPNQSQGKEAEEMFLKQLCN
jgi:hypothetical protein